MSDRMHIGCAWYPEQTPREQWGGDLDLMRAADLNVVRVGEFAWSRFEPAEDRFDFDWMDEAVALAAQRGFAVIMSTPTAAPPVWLT